MVAISRASGAWPSSAPSRARCSPSGSDPGPALRTPRPDAGTRHQHKAPGHDGRGLFAFRAAGSAAGDVGGHAIGRRGTPAAPSRCRCRTRSDASAAAILSAWLIMVATLIGVPREMHPDFLKRRPYLGTDGTGTGTRCYPEWPIPRSRLMSLAPFRCDVITHHVPVPRPQRLAATRL